MSEFVKSVFGHPWQLAGPGSRGRPWSGFCQCRRPSLSTSVLKPDGSRGASRSLVALQIGQGIPQERGKFHNGTASRGCAALITRYTYDLGRVVDHERKSPRGRVG